MNKELRIKLGAPAITLLRDRNSVSFHAPGATPDEHCSVSLSLSAEGAMQFDPSQDYEIVISRVPAE